MKRTQVALRITLLGVVALLSACSTLYTSTVTITQVVDSAMKDWAQMSVAGKTSTAIDTAVVKAHDQYRAACGVAQTALVAYKNSGDSTEYVKAIVAVRAAADGLFAIITPLMPQSKATTLRTQLAKASGV